MRSAVLAAIIVLSACASDALRSAPPSGVDFTGRWKLNEADSDDPLHLQQTANSEAAARAGESGSSGGRGGRGGRGGSQGVGYPGLSPPATPSMGALAEALRFPGKQLELKQVGGVVAFTSDGKNRICQPGDAKKGQRHRSSASDRDAPLPARRDTPPPSCGWSDKTLIVHGNDPDEDRPPYEELYSISEDGQRLVEEVSFRGGRSNGFTLSRVWDRLP
ncbi:MAG TPA: hypothetical protein VK523_06275 [Steroidobacteraceae bacterium]|nr:hypothetical protein [Steroidobacteraceae bacterium]